MAVAARQGRGVRILIGALMLCVLAAGRAAAQTMWVSGNPSLWSLSTSATGTASITDLNTTYSIFNYSGSKRKITAQMDSPMPAGMTLTVTLERPGGSSGATVTLDTTPRDAVWNISSGNFSSGRKITYVVSATSAAGTVPRQTRTVTFTVTAYP